MFVFFYFYLAFIYFYLIVSYFSASTETLFIKLSLVVF